MINRSLDFRGSLVIEAILVMAGVLLPILLAVAAITSVLDSQNKLELIVREASRAFALASSNNLGLVEVNSLQQKHQSGDFPLKISVNCTTNCSPGSRYLIVGLVDAVVVEIPFLPDMTIQLKSEISASIDRFIER